MKIILPDDIQRLCDEINRCGYNTYIIGSSLRAVVFGYDVDKWDIITSATPDELHSIFNKSEISLRFLVYCKCLRPKSMVFQS